MLVKRGKNSNRNETLKYFLTIFKIVCNEKKQKYVAEKINITIRNRKNVC